MVLKFQDIVYHNYPKSQENTFIFLQDNSSFVKNNYTMKTKYIKNKTQFNFRVNEEDYKMLEMLREKHSINISNAFKTFLYQLKDKLEKI